MFHYENTPIQFTAIFYCCNNDNFKMKNYKVFLIFAQNIDCGYAVVMSTHNVCFRAKIRKNVYLCTPQFHYLKMGCKGV